MSILSMFFNTKESSKLQNGYLFVGLVQFVTVLGLFVFEGFAMSQRLMASIMTLLVTTMMLMQGWAWIGLLLVPKNKYVWKMIGFLFLTIIPLLILGIYVYQGNVPEMIKNYVLMTVKAPKDMVTSIIALF